MKNNFYPFGTMFNIKTDNKRQIYEIIGHDEEENTYTLKRMGMNVKDDDIIVVGIDVFDEEPIGISSTVMNEYPKVLTKRNNNK